MATPQKSYEDFKALGLKLDMSRGKPSREQLDISMALIDGSLPLQPVADDGTDYRNYGELLGIKPARALFADLLDVTPAQLVAGANSSLALMHDTLAFLMLHGAPGHAPWRHQEPLSFICPVPGYDRHFAICESLGIRMINVPLLEDGPDMDQVESLVAGDASVKGMWCMPKYSNPTGTIYSEAVVQRLASMPTAAADFRLLWDDAYRFHHLTEVAIPTPQILSLCAAAGHPDRAMVYASTSKMTFAGGGVAVLAASPANIEWWRQRSSIQTIGPDKLNQLRHVQYLRDASGVATLMEQHRAHLQPRFEAVQEIFQRYLGEQKAVRWTQPKGGYFINLQTPPGLARATVALAREAGLTLTPAGASFPYGRDPDDQHIRVAPTYPTLAEVRLAAEGIALSLLRAIASA